jgi:hypothetical protein
MPLVNVVLTLLVVGVLLWLVNSYIPMQSVIKWMLKLFGLWHYVSDFRIGS